MKKIMKYMFLACAVVLALTACSPDDNHSLGDIHLTQDMVSFDLTPGSDEFTYDFAVSFSVAPKFIYRCEIQFGDDKSVKGLYGIITGNHEYIVPAGNYTATCIITLPNGEVVIKEKTISITKDNPKIFKDDPSSPQFALTGGKDNLEGKVWSLTGGSGLGPGDGTWGEWWNFGNEPNLFDDEFIFMPNGIQTNGKYIHDTKGATFMNESLGNLFPDGNPSGSFVTLEYTPSTSATWEITARGGKNWLIINKGFVGYAVTPNDLDKTEYEILSFSTKEVKLKYYSPDGNAWFFFLTSDAPTDPLTGEGSKTWVIDGYNKHTDEVKAATGLNIKGFIGLGPVNSYGQEWWGAGPGDKSFDSAGWTLYDWKITFTSAGELKIVTAGEGYGRKAFNGQGFTSTKIDGDDMSFVYDGGNYTYTQTKASPYPILTLSGNAFLGYYTGTQEYEIVYLSETALAVVSHDTVEGQDWVVIFTPDGQQ